MTQILPTLQMISAVIFGTADYQVFTDDYNEACKLIKDYTKSLNGRLAN